MPERPEIVWTARPTPVRLWGFLCLAAGAMVAGYGAVSDWAVLGFPPAFQGAPEAPVKGVDLWEGLAVLGAGVLALVGMLATRLVLGIERRRVLAFGLTTLGALVIALALSVAMRVDSRLGGTAGLDTLAADIAAQTGEDPIAVRELLEGQIAEDFRVDVRPGLWIAAAGGVLIDIGGALSLAWVRRMSASAAEDAPSSPASTP